MTFLTASLLFGLAAAAVPVLIHLLHRQRTVPVQWGAMQFLLESQLQFRRRKKVDHWLLLLARMLLLALLAFLLARPLLKSGALNALPGNGATDIAIVVDHSLSAGRKTVAEATATGEGAESPTVFDRGIDIVQQVGATMRPNDTLSVVLAEHRPDTSLTPLPIRSSGASEVTKRLREMKPGLTAAGIPDAVQAARELLARGPNAQKVIYVVSDEQRNAWQVENAGAWSGGSDRNAGASASAKIYSVPVPAAPRGRNVTVADVSIEPGVVGVKRPAQVTATLANAGPGDAPALTATLFVAGKEAGKQSVTDLKAGASRTVRFDHAFADAGSTWVEVRTDADDDLKADDAAVAAVNVLRRLPVLVIDGQLTTAGTFRASQFLVAAMQPVADDAQSADALIQPKVISASAADAEKLDDYAAVIVNDVPQLGATALENLAAYARSGHGVWVILGPRTDPAALGPQLASAGLFSADFREKRTPQQPPGVELKTPQNPMVALVAAAERNAMTGAIAKQWWSIVPKNGDEQIVLATSQTGDPLVLERPVGRSGGRVVVWCSSADGAWNNWPLMPNFVPLVNETVYHLAAARTRSAEGRRLEAGMPIEWSAGSQPRVKSATITRPDGTTVQRQPALTGGRQRLSYNDTADPGLYALRFDPTEIPQPVYYGVGLDRRELDTTPLSEADHAWLKTRNIVESRLAPTEVASALGGGPPAAELSKYLALGVLALLVFETVMTHRMARLQAAPAPDHAGS